ncbi:hypothetical protein CALCODRAFT_489058 [Calocera cornea HHB12733]|uniref:DNA 3'-5' helicase n=1 Tax=Calocera cornea HHB12733 TaxID=1353952 RepID=A0A165AMX1_9BASI|nr:hypothetical protein CALCODRAFT_489058 [Calocera cornea HHB12733]
MEDFKGIMHKGKRYLLSSIRDGMPNMVRSVEKLVEEVALQGMKLDWIQSTLDEIFDDPSKITDLVSEHKVGYSFLTDPSLKAVGQAASRLALLQAFSDLDAKSLNRAPTLFRRSGAPGAERREIDPTLARVYLLRLERVKLSLAVIAHLTGGGLTRGTELMIAKTYNDEETIRNLFWYRGYVLLHTTYVKTRANGGGAGLNVRAYPKRVSALFLIMLLWVKPFEVYLFNSVLKDPDAASMAHTYFFSNGKGRLLSSERFGNVLEELTQEHFGAEMSIAIVRQLWQTFIRDVVTNGVDIARVAPMSDDIDDSPLDRQFGHSATVAQSFYGRMGTSFNDAPELVIHLQILLSQSLHHFFGLGPAPTSGTGPAPTSTPRALLVPNPRLPVSHVALPADIIEQLRKEITESSTKTLVAIHAMLAADTRGERASSRALSRLSDRHRAVSMKELRPLRAMLQDPSARFRSASQAAYAACLTAGDLNLLVVTPTGSGKTFGVAYPFFAGERGISVLISPFVALKAQCLCRLQELGMPVEIWHEHSAMSEGVVVLSVEVASSWTFMEWLISNADAGIIKRVYIDEAHQLVINSHFRVAFSLLSRLHRANVQWVLLTATLTPGAEADLINALKLTTAHFRCIRDPCVRGNLEFSFFRLPDARALLAAVVSKLTTTSLPPGQRGIVFCRTKGAAEALTARFPQSALVTGETSDVDRDQALVSWLDGTVLWLFGTSAIEQGLDHPAVARIYWLGAPYNLTALVQAGIKHQ